MLQDDTRRKIKYITEGTIIEGSQDNCTAARNFLCASFPTSTTVKKDFESKALIKEEQVKLLQTFCNNNNLWIADIPSESLYLTRGGEARVYLNTDNKSVIKLNDGIYYATWLEFLNSILLHNLIFENTAYDLLGFIKSEGSFYAVLKQPYIIAENVVDLADVKKLLGYNGFINTKRNDYYNKELGLILEDMHDENVLVHSETLFFIDSVFYTVSSGDKSM